MVAMIPPKLPIVEIRQTYAQIGMQSTRGIQTIEQPKPDFEMRREAPELSIEQPLGELIIDQSRAWDALAIGNHLEMMLRIYQQDRQIALETIGKIAEHGDRLAAIHLGGSPIADIAAEEGRFTFGEYLFAGPADVDNVDIYYQANKPLIEVREGRIHVDARAKAPVINYWPGKLEIYIKQYNSIQFIPPQIDVAV